jgi:hypothetical protein
MPILSRRTVAALAALCCLLAAPGFAVPAHAAGDNSNVMQALRDGGLVIIVRHGATFPDQADTDPLNFNNIAAQRNLNDKGRTLAKTFGDAIRQAGVPVGKVFTSKYNRHRADAWYQHDSHYAQAEHRRCARQGLVRRQRGRSLNLPARER